MAGPVVIPQGQQPDPLDPQSGGARAAAYDPFYAEQAETTRQQDLAQQIRAAALQQLQRSGQPMTIQGPVGPMTTGPGAGAALAGISANILGLGMEHNALKRQSALNQQRFQMMDSDIQQGMDLLGKPLPFENEYRTGPAGFTVDEEAVARNNILHKQWQRDLLKHAGHITSFYGDLPGAKEAAALIGSVGAKDNAYEKVNENTVRMSRSGQPGSVMLKANSPLVLGPNQTAVPETGAGLQAGAAVTAPSGPMQVQPGTNIFAGTPLSAPGLGAGQPAPAPAAAPQGSQPGDISSPTGAPIPAAPGTAAPAGMQVLAKGAIRHVPMEGVPGVSVAEFDPTNPAHFVDTYSGEKITDPGEIARIVRKQNAKKAADAINNDKGNYINVQQTARQALESMMSAPHDRTAELAFVRNFERLVNAPMTRVPIMAGQEREAFDTLRDQFSNFVSKYNLLDPNAPAMSEATRNQMLRTGAALLKAVEPEARLELQNAIAKAGATREQYAPTESDVASMLPFYRPLGSSAGVAAPGTVQHAAPQGHGAAATPARPAVKDPAAQWKMVPR